MFAEARALCPDHVVEFFLILACGHFRAQANAIFCDATVVNAQPDISDM